MADQNNATAMNVGKHKKTSDGIDTDNLLSLMWSIKDEFISPKPSVTDVTDVIEIETAPYRLNCVLNGIRTVAEWNCGNKECLISKAWWQKHIKTSKFMISKDKPRSVINAPIYHRCHSPPTVPVLGGTKLWFTFDGGAFSHKHPLIDFRVVEGSTPEIPIIGQNAMRYLAYSFTKKAIGYTIASCNYSVSCKLNGIYTRAVLRSESSVSYVHTAWTDLYMPNEVRPLAELNSGQGMIRFIAGVPCERVSGWILAKLSIDTLAKQALNVPMLVVTGPETTTVIGANVLRPLIKNKPLEKQEELKPISPWQTLEDIEMYADLTRKCLNFVDKASDWLVKLDEPDYNGGIDIDSIEEDVPSATPGSVCEEAPAKPAPGATAQDELKKASVKIFLEVLVSRIFRKAKMNWTTADYKAIIMRLLERTWIEVQGVDFDPTLKTFKELDKAIIQDLCKKWGSVEMVFSSMLSEDPELGNCIASSVKDHLMTQPKKRSTICTLS